MPNSPTTCPVCQGTACNAEAHLPAVRIRALERTVHTLADRLAAVEARLPVGHIHQPWCRVRSGERACNCYSGRPAPPPSAEPTPRPTIAELEAILAKPDDAVTVAILPNGELRAHDKGCGMDTDHRGPCRPAPVTSDTRTQEEIDRPAEEATAAIRAMPGGLASLYTTAPVASGASVPDGYVLGKGWALSKDPVFCWECPSHPNGPQMGFYRHDFPCRGACPLHAEYLEAIVPVEPPKAETAQAGEAPRCEVCGWRLAATIEGGCVTGNCSYRPDPGSDEWYRVQERRAELKQPAAPSAPVGQKWECDQCGAKVAHGDADLRERLLHGDYRCPNHAHPDRSCDGLLKWQPIAEPAAPPHPESNQTYPRVDCKVRAGRSCHHETCQPAALPVAARRSPFAAVLADAVPGDDGAEARLRAATDAAVAGRATRPFPSVAAELSGCKAPVWCGTTATKVGPGMDAVKGRDYVIGWMTEIYCSERCRDLRHPQLTGMPGDISHDAAPLWMGQRRAFEAGAALAHERTAALQTALAEARKSYRALEMELDTAMRDRGQLREQLNVARREVDTAKAENEALRAKFAVSAPDAKQHPSCEEWCGELVPNYCHVEAWPHRGPVHFIPDVGVPDEAWCIANDLQQDIVRLNKQFATRDRRIALLEASHREDVEKAVREERERCVVWHRMRGPGLILLPWKNVEDAIERGDPVPKVGG